MLLVSVHVVLVLKGNLLLACHVVLASTSQEILVFNAQLIVKPVLELDAHLVLMDIS